MSNNHYFALFGVPVSFDVNKDTLKARYLDLQKQHHPDQHGGETASASLINHAYNTLHRDDERALYLLDLAGQDVNLNDSIGDLVFLDTMIELRMDLEDANATSDIESLAKTLDNWISEHSATFAVAYNAQDWTAAKIQAQKLKFLGNLFSDVKDKASRLSISVSDDDDLYV